MGRRDGTLVCNMHPSLPRLEICWSVRLCLSLCRRHQDKVSEPSLQLHIELGFVQVFEYVSGEHNVVQLTEPDCGTLGSGREVAGLTASPYTFNVSSNGFLYFACSVGGDQHITLHAPQRHRPGFRRCHLQLLLFDLTAMCAAAPHAQAASLWVPSSI